jgi:hypothetical protein
MEFVRRINNTRTVGFHLHLLWRSHFNSFQKILKETTYIIGKGREGKENELYLCVAAFQLWRLGLVRIIYKTHIHFTIFYL